MISKGKYVAEDSKIEWTDHTFNPWEGCQKVGPGCDHCYAEARNARFGGGVAVNWGVSAPRRRTSDANWRKPITWNEAHEAFFAEHGRRQRVFCASLADVFDNAVDPIWRAELFDLIATTPHLDWLLLTKRIGNAHDMMLMGTCWDPFHPLPNVWLGATVVNQEEADRDIPKLLAVPARVRFLSIEPMLGPIQLGRWLWTCCGNMQRGSEADGLPDGACCGQPERAGQLDWVIVGGESGPGARDFDIGWCRSIVAQCKAAEVPVMVKQMGAKPVWSDDDEDSEPPHWGRIRYADKKGGDWAEWPEDLRVREFP